MGATKRQAGQAVFLSHFRGSARSGVVGGERGLKRETYEITRGTATLACHETPRPGESYWSGGIFSLFPLFPPFPPVQIDSLTLYSS